MKRLLCIGIVVAGSTAIVRADLITYDLSSTAANALNKLGSQFVWGCTVLTVGIVAAAFLSRKK